MQGCLHAWKSSRATSSRFKPLKPHVPHASSPSSLKPHSPRALLPRLPIALIQLSSVHAGAGAGSERRETAAAAGASAAADAGGDDEDDARDRARLAAARARGKGRRQVVFSEPVRVRARASLPGFPSAPSFRAPAAVWRTRHACASRAAGCSLLARFSLPHTARSLCRPQ